MSSITAQQAKLDLELVPKEKILDIGKCNGRLNPGKIQREPTFQVVLDALALTPCYSAFLITADVQKVYMYQFWDSIYKHDIFYRFKIDKRKRFKLTLEVFRDIFKICPRVHGQDFDALPSDEEIMSFLRDLGHTREIHSLNDVVVDQMHQPWRTFAALINRSLSGKTTGLDKLRLSRAQILWGMYHQKNVDYVELLWEDFIYQIDNKAYKKQDKMYYPRFTKVIIHYFLTQDKTLSWRNKIGMHTSKDDYLINTLRFVSAREETQIYGAILPESLTSPEMKETKAYKTYLGFATGATPPKKARKFKKPASPKLTIVPASTEEPTRKSKKVKRPAKKSTQAPARAQLKEVRKKSLRDFHKTHPSGSGTVAEKPPSVEKITPTVTSEETGDKRGVPNVTEDDSTESESDGQENESEEQESDLEQDEESDDDNQEEEEVDQENESEDDEIESDEDKGMDDTTNQFDVCADVEMIDTQQGNENLETTQEQVVEDAHVTISTVMKKTEVSATSSSRSSELASKFLNFSNIPHTDAEIVSLLDVHVHHEVPRTQAPTLLTIPVSVITESSLVGEKPEKQFMNFLSESLMARIKEQVKEQLALKFCPRSVNFISSSLMMCIPLRGESRQKTKTKKKPLTADQTRGLRREKRTKMPDRNPLSKKRKDSTSAHLKAPKSQNQNLLECLLFNQGTSFELDWENPEGDDYPFNLSKPLPLITLGNRQRVPFELFINNDLKYLQGGILTMTYMTSTTKTKAAKYDLPGIEDMVPNIRASIKRRCNSFNSVFCITCDMSKNWLTNLSRDNVADFAIALRMFTKSLVIQKRVEDLQLGVESYQKKINVTKPDSLPRPILTQQDQLQNRSDELYKFSDGTLTRLLSSLKDITKNIDMEYLLKRRWRNLEKKRAHFMIKDINKLLKERRMMRSSEKFIGGRLYGTDLGLLQRTI
ncbi:hypothetical protein Tco_1402869 [Tanacetum coccineum]